MSFSPVTANPSWGTASSATFYKQTAPIDHISHTVYNAAEGNTGLLSVGTTFLSAAFNTSGVTKPLAGWITYSGGGPARPTSGFIYPRGDC